MKKNILFVALLIVLVFAVTLVSVQPKAVVESAPEVQQLDFDDVGPDIRNPIGRVFAGF